MTNAELCAELDARGLSFTESGHVLDISRRQITNLRSGSSTITPSRDDSIRMRLARYDSASPAEQGRIRSGMIASAE